MGNGNRIWLLFRIFALRQELFDKNTPHITELATVDKSLPHPMSKAHKQLIYNLSLFSYRILTKTYAYATAMRHARSNVG